MLKAKAHKAVTWLTAGALLLGLISSSTQQAIASTPSGSWTVEAALSSSGATATQVINDSVVLSFHLINPNSSTVTFTNSGVGEITASSHTSGFIDGIPSPLTYPVQTYSVTGDGLAEDIESITVSSNVAGTQKLSATVLDQSGGLVSQLNFTVTWVASPQNFNFKVTKGYQLVPGTAVVFLSTDSVTGKLYNSGTPVTDSLGEARILLPDGTSIAFINNDGADGTQYLSTYFKVIALGGVIQRVSNSQGAQINPDSSTGLYQLAFTSTNVQGTFTIDGVLQLDGKVSGAFDLALKQYKSFEQSYVNGKFAIKLPIGSYRIFLTPSNGITVPVTCTVTSAPLTTCDANGSAKNFKVQIDDLAGNPLPVDAGWAAITSTVVDSITRSDYLAYDPLNNYYYITDGNYSIEIRARNESANGLSRTYKFGVSDGVVSNLTDNLTGEVAVVDSNGVYHLRLLAPNFVAHLNANANPAPLASVYYYQTGSKESRWATSDSSGTVKLDLPDGLNLVTIRPSGNESPTVVAATYGVLVENRIVQSVSRDSGETLSAGVDSAYTLDFATPNIVGSFTREGVPSYGWIAAAWNTVLNQQVSVQALTDVNGNFAVLVPAGNYDFLVNDKSGLMAGVQNCSATAGVVTRCDVNFPANNLTINLEGESGAPLTSGITADINRQNIGGQSFALWWKSQMRLNSSGQLQSSLLDGAYTLRVASSNPIIDGVARIFNFTIASGIVSTLEDIATGETITSVSNAFNVPLSTPNLKAVVLANGIPDPFVSYFSSGKTSKGYYFNSNTDANGNFAEELPDGEYELRISAKGNESPPVVNTYYNFSIANGVIVNFADFDGNPVSAINGIYQLNLNSPNVLGSITVAGQLASDKPMWFQGLYSSDVQNWVPTQLSSNGWLGANYGLRAAAGNYFIAASEYGKGTIFTPCVVATTGISTCDISIPADNFRFKVQSTDGLDLLSNVGANGNLTLQNTGSGFWLQMGTGGFFSTPLQIPTGTTGYYQISVYPTDGSSRHGVGTTYKVELASDGLAVETVTNQLTGEVITPNPDGVYGLKLTGANITGTVVTQDGKTPVANAQACAGSGQNYSMCMFTDSSGAFAARTNIDGTYQVFAQPPTFDMTKSESERATLVVTGGASTPGSVTLALRTPNVTGVVHGPDGLRVSPSNYLQILKDDGTGNFIYAGWDVAVARPTDSTGNFAFHLDPGKYKFQAQADEKNTGGTATVSPVCEVLNTTDSYDCGFSLNSSNTKLQIFGEGGKPYTQAHIYYKFAGNKANPGVMPSKYWDYNGFDKFGQAKNFLEDGTWNAQIYPYGTGIEAPISLIITVESGAVTSIVDELGNSFALGTNGYFQIQLPISNLIGAITSGGKQIDYWSTVYLLQDNGGYYNAIRGQGFGGGKFSFLVAPGTYAIQVIPYPNTAYSSGTPVSTKLLNCVVPQTGTANCDVALQAGNLLGKIVTPSGNATTDTYAYLNQTNLSEQQVAQKSSKFDTQISVYNGQFSAHLESGEYNLVVTPGWKFASGYTPRTYKIIVDTTASPVITSVIDLTSGVLISPDSSGRFSFALSLATVTGSVYKSGGSLETIPYAQIVAADPVTGNELWQYSTQADYLGNYALSLPDGTYKLKAKSWGWYGEGVSTSEIQTVTISGEVLRSGGPNPVNLRMQDPNFTMKVVIPRTSTGIPNIYLSGNFNGQYLGGVTDNSGIFRAYIDTSTATSCTAGPDCQITIYPKNNPLYSSSSCAITTLDGSVQVCEIGEVTSRLTIRIPTNGGIGLPNSWSWASVEELVNETNTVINRTGYGANALGQIGLGLVAGHHYLITAYPSGDYYDRYSPKTLAIPNFDPADPLQANLDLTFDSPNITFIVSDRNSNGNSWGWFEAQKKDGTGQFAPFNNGYLNSQGRGAQFLPDGDYQITFYPGKAIGVSKVITFTISSTGSVTTITNAVGASFSGAVGRVILGSGNVTGTVTSSGNRVANIPVTATSTAVGDSTTISTVSKSDGTYELNLDTSKSWSISALDPLTASLVTLPELTASFTSVVANIELVL